MEAPGPVEILREACHATSGKAILHWQPKTKGVVDSYTITCLIKTLSWTEEIAKVTCPQPYQIFTDLRPSTKYIFQICANNKCGPSPPETVELFTKPPLPLVLQAGNATGSSIQIKWCDYNLGDLKIIYYLLSYRLAARSSYQIQTNDDWGEISNIMGLEYILDGLNSRSRYDVKVTALYQAGTSVTSEVFQYWTRGM
ncbi:PREDICTED: Down syndrome cell adhesion molecule-like protein Dscam2 [Branchiostoma belcheri]|uniref:Down syndrome cell adhesion molecule-like protein Dscam2 n=1 Tax=Branchiostoma belcheri TaxID=7741 RepID=A0A6P4YU51_BRABE|nr:PREDICTED: Down syndrome cell adhesion molecule-like protein Dscam2 [Branchiostoma belcheri]